VVVLQEAFLLRLGIVGASYEVATLSRELAAMGLVYNTTSITSPPLFGQNSGLSVFSRIPLVNCEIINFIHTDEIINRKGFLMVQFEWNDNRIILINTHFDSRKSETKKKQIYQLAGYVETLFQSLDKSVNFYFMVCGDFNICSSENKVSLYKELTGSLFGYDIFGPPSLSTHMHGGSLDHFFVDKNDKIKVEKSEVKNYVDLKTGISVSDHFALDVTLKMKINL